MKFNVLKAKNNLSIQSLADAGVPSDKQDELLKAITEYLEEAKAIKKIVGTSDNEGAWIARDEQIDKSVGKINKTLQEMQLDQATLKSVKQIIAHSVDRGR